MQHYFALNENLDLTKDDIYHIVKVMRMNLNDKLIVVYKQRKYFCEIINFNKKDIKLKVIKEIFENNELHIKVTIGQALIKETKFCYLLQKLTELGVNSVIPLKTARSLIKLDSIKETNKKLRWHKILKEAAEQAHRNIIPNLHSIIDIKDIDYANYDLKLVCSVNQKNKNIKQIIQKHSKCDKLLVVIGPEGGLRADEEQFLINEGFIPVSLGSLILRTETAALFIMSIINYENMR